MLILAACSGLISLAPAVIKYCSSFELNDSMSLSSLIITEKSWFAFWVNLFKIFSDDNLSSA